MSKAQTSLFLAGRPLVFDPNRTVGSGGEGDVYEWDGGTMALKIFKPPDHPDYAGTDAQSERDREGARRRLELMSRKLPAYPRVSDRVVAPRELVTDQNGVVRGYTMPLITGAQVLRQLSKPGFRLQAAIDNNQVLAIFRDLYATVADLHAKGVQIGDFNHLGVLFKQGSALLIDADSFQFQKGPLKFSCRSFTPRFVDPLICMPDELVLQGDHSDNTDWYAFALMLFESLLYVAPYGGVLTGDLAQKVKPDDRPLKRISVFHKDIRYPDKGTPLNRLSDAWLEFYRRLLLNDWRGQFPAQLLEQTNWVTCSSCGAMHCRRLCPACAVFVPGAVIIVPAEERHGKVTILRQFQTPGVILDAYYSGGRLHILFHEEGTFYRQEVATSKQKILAGDLRPGLVTSISGNTTIFASGHTLARVVPGEKHAPMPVDSYRGQFPVVSTTGEHYVWVDGGRILRDDPLGTKFLGSTIRGQTMLWAGSRFGFGTYRVGEIRRSFIFELDRQSLNDSVQLPPFPSDPIDAECAFSSNCCWFFTTHEERGRTINRCSVINHQGKVIASAEAQEGDGSWLGSGHGRAATTLPRSGKEPINALFIVSDDGLLRVDVETGAFTEKARFADTKGLVRSDDRLVLGSNGIYLVGNHEIRLLRMQ